MQLRRPARHALVFSFSLLAFAGLSAAGPGAEGSGQITIRLEKKQAEQALTVPPTTVFKTGDVLRFRLTSSMAGYLYVVDKGSTGMTATLFPASGAQAGDNHILPARGYLVPADGEGWFEVTGPPGFDVLYFLVSARPMALPPAPPSPEALGKKAQPEAALPPDLLPRCNDEIFRSRGECLDETAGARALSPDAVLPREIAGLALGASRDIILVDEGGQTSVRPAATAKLPLVYSFRLAHR
ncbi:MAG TPA: DUF4384 domain-containing protein [Acidobacteriaceae bacterium]